MAKKEKADPGFEVVERWMVDMPSCLIEYQGMKIRKDNSLTVNEERFSELQTRAETFALLYTLLFPDEQQLVSLHFLKGRTLDEIAAEQGVSEITVRKLRNLVVCTAKAVFLNIPQFYDEVLQLKQEKKAAKVS